MKDKTIKVIRKAPGKLPEMLDVENSLEALQKEVGGYIEAVTIAEDMTILCDEEGRLKGKQLNWAIPKMGLDFVGTILFVGVKGDEFCDVSEPDFILWNFFRMVRYGRADRKHNVWNCRHCGHLQEFEADGPFENGWNICPVCTGMLLKPADYE